MSFNISTVVTVFACTKRKDTWIIRSSEFPASIKRACAFHFQIERRSVNPENADPPAILQIFGCKGVPYFAFLMTKAAEVS